MGTFRAALQLPDMRRIELGYGMSITGELAGTVALVVYALGAGGAALVAAYAAASSALSGTYRPLQAAVLPWLVRTPAELAASNGADRRALRPRPGSR